MTQHPTKNKNTVKCKMCKGTGHDHSIPNYPDPMTPCQKCAGMGKLKIDIAEIEGTTPHYYAYGERDYALYVNGKKLMSGHQADVKEKIEDLLATVTGISILLQESNEEGNFSGLFTLR